MWSPFFRQIIQNQKTMSSEDFAPIDFTEIESTQEKEQQDKFQQLYTLNLNDKVENKNGLTYLSWANAWAAFKTVYPNATYRIIKNPQTNLPFFMDENLGIMVFTEVTADHQTYEMWLPVMDSTNKAMRLSPYTYQVWDKKNNKYFERKVEAASMFDINKTVMRCLVKNLAMFGLGLYIFAGEDMPETLSDVAMQTPVQDVAKPRSRTRKPQQQVDRYAGIRTAINAAHDTTALLNLYHQHENEVNGNPEILALFTERKLQLQAA